MSKKNDLKKNVVIVGGGFFGTLAARQLSQRLDPSKYNLILISDRPYLVFLIAGARMVVSDEPQFSEQALVPHDHLFINNNGTFKLGKVSSIEEAAPGQGGEVILTNGERVPYAALVLATGSIWNGPLDFPEGDKDLRSHTAEWRQRIAAAKNIILIGGGAVGTETAGEIRDLYPEKKITIVQASDMLLNQTYPEKFRRDIERRVRKRGIDVLCGEYVDEVPEPGTKGVRTRSGKEFPDVDLVIPAFGARPNAHFVASLGSDVLSNNGFVKVDQTLQVRGHPGVFAVGDIIEWNEQKQAAKAAGHLGVVVPNILALLEGRTPPKVYKGSLELIVVPIGRKYGAGYLDILWGICLGDWFSSFVKGKDLMVPQARKDRGM